MGSCNTSEKASIENIYKLDGMVPFFKALPFGLQHILTMFMANLAPIIMITSSANPTLTPDELAKLIQNAMFISGIATLIQLYPVWKIGAKLPIVMGCSFTFTAVLGSIAANHGYGAAAGAVIVAGLFEGSLGLLITNWNKVVAPIVCAAVVMSIGLSLFSVGARAFGGGYTDYFGSEKNLILGSFTLIVCILWSVYSKGFFKQLSILMGMIAGYILALFLHQTTLSNLLDNGLVSFPHILPIRPTFDLADIISVAIVFLVSAAETVGDSSAVVSGGLNREITNKELSGSIACDGFSSSLSGLFGCPPTTSFSQNVGLINMTKVVNRFTIMTGVLCMLLASIFPPMGTFFSSLPEAVLGGCTITMFGSILVSGLMMASKCGFSQRNIIILSISLSIGLGFTAPSEANIWLNLPTFFRSVFADNCVALVFVLAFLLNLFLPQESGDEKVGS